MTSLPVTSPWRTRPGPRIRLAPDRPRSCTSSPTVVRGPVAVARWRDIWLNEGFATSWRSGTPSRTARDHHRGCTTTTTATARRSAVEPRHRRPGSGSTSSAERLRPRRDDARRPAQPGRQRGLPATAARLGEGARGGNGTSEEFESMAEDARVRTWATSSRRGSGPAPAAGHRGVRALAGALPRPAPPRRQRASRGARVSAGTNGRRVPACSDGEPLMDAKK